MLPAGFVRCSMGGDVFRDELRYSRLLFSHVCHTVEHVCEREGLQSETEGRGGGGGGRGVERGGGGGEGGKGGRGC